MLVAVMGPIGMLLTRIPDSELLQQAPIVPLLVSLIAESSKAPEKSKQLFSQLKQMGIFERTTREMIAFMRSIFETKGS